MNKINWGQKLSSRKFWVTLMGFIASVLFAFNVAEVQVEKVTGVISTMSLLVTYILTEGYIDSKRKNGDIIVSTQNIVEKNN